MKKLQHTFRVAAFAAAAIAMTAGPVAADSMTTVSQAVNFFQNAQATGGAPATVDAKGPVEITDQVELPGFAFNVYDVDFTANSVTMKLVASLEKLQITLYDNTTFDRYYFAFDQKVTSAELAESTDENFKAMVEVIQPGTSISAAKAFVDGLGTDFTFENGGIVVTIGEGTDLTKVTENGGAITVNF